VIAIPKPLNLGQIVATPAALEAIEASGQAPADFLRRHASKDWGDLDDEDKRLNDEALQDGSRILSAYHTSDGTKLWVITEAEDDDGQRAATTILLPEEY
jgi:choline dehydrogenase-like flavoprotein